MARFREPTEYYKEQVRLLEEHDNNMRRQREANERRTALMEAQVQRQPQAIQYTPGSLWQSLPHVQTVYCDSGTTSATSTITTDTTNPLDGDISATVWYGPDRIAFCGSPPVRLYDESDHVPVRGRDILSKLVLPI